MRESAISGRLPDAAAAVLWHDLECGSYSADLGIWEELADAAGGEVLDLGCGTGRVSLHLGRHGHRATGLDADPVLSAEMARRAAGAGLPVVAEVGDAREFDLGRRFALVLAPMQLIQLFERSDRRRDCLACARRHLEPGALLAVAILAEDGGAEGTEDGPPVPDVRELDGFLYSSLPVAALGNGVRIVIRRLRQTVTPNGALRDEINEVELADLTAETLESEAGTAGLRAVARRRIAPTTDHVGSTVILLEAR